MTAGTDEQALVCVTGRFQPVHQDHLALFRVALAAGGRLIVAVTNPDPGARRQEAASEHRHRAHANPFTFLERLELLMAALGAEEELGRDGAAQVRIVPFDLTRPEHWSHYVPLSAVQYVGVHGPWEQDKADRLAAAGYRVVQVPGHHPQPRRSSTAIRAAMRTGPDWEQLVPAATVPTLRVLLARRTAAGSLL